MTFGAKVGKVALLLTLISAVMQGQVVLTGNSFTSSVSPKTNFSSSIAMVVGPGSNTYLQFSFASLPSGINGSNISAANVVVFVDAVLASGTMDVYAVNGSWSANTINYNNAPPLGSKILSAVPISATGYVSLNVTSTVQAWLNGTQPNYGIALVPTSGSPILAAIDSINNILTSHPAQVNLVLTSAGAQGPQGPPGPAGAAGPTGPQGPQGPAGANGAAGPQGTAGAQGATGAQGPQGLPGPTGATGAAGSQGPAGATGAMGLTGAQGPQGVPGPQGPAGTGGGLNGIQEFTHSGIFTVPPTVSSILVELWGAGGGGQGGNAGYEICTIQNFVQVCSDAIGPSGGAGGGGSYSRAVIQVTPGATITVTIGQGGAGGAGGTDDSNCNASVPGYGSTGGSTTVADSSGNTLASAVGGGSPGGGVGVPAQNVIVRNGGSGGAQNAPGLPPSGSIPLPGSAGQGGIGGNGNTGCGYAGFQGGTGQNGYALLTF